MFTGAELAFTAICQFCDGCQDFVRPAEQFRLAGLPGVYVLAPGLEDCQPDAVKIVEAPESVKRAQAVAHELGILVGFDQDTDTVLQIDYMQHTVGHDDAVAGAVAVFDPFGVIQRLLNADKRVFAQRLCRFHLFQDKVPVGFRRFLHLCIIIGKVLGRVLAFPPQRFLHLVLCQFMRTAALDGVFAGLVSCLGAELCAGWAGQPAVAGGSGKVRMVSHGRSPSLPPSSPPRYRGRPLLKVSQHRTLPASP